MIIRSHQHIAAFTPSCYNMSIQTEQHKEDQGMKEIINVFDYAEQLNKVLPQGILLNTNGEKFNSMVIGWGHRFMSARAGIPNPSWIRRRSLQSLRLFPDSSARKCSGSAVVSPVGIWIRKKQQT